MRSFASALAGAVLSMVATWPAPAGGQSVDCLINAVANGPYCVGDCNRDGVVQVSEVVGGVRILEGEKSMRECRALDLDENNLATVGELVRAVDAALDGCALPSPLFDQRLRLRLAPGPDTGDPLLLVLQTEDIYPCLNYRLAAALRVEDDTIVVVLGCVFPPPICLDALGPAGFNGDIDLAPGAYVLELRAQGATDRYRVDVSSDAVRVEPIDATFSSLF